MSKIVNVTIRLRLKTDPSDAAQMEADIAEVLQEYIDDEGLVEIADVEEDDAEEEEGEDF